MPSPPILTLQDATITFGGRPTFSGVSVAIARGDRACLVGRNGSGKSTLLRVLVGSTDLDSGTRFQQPGARIAYMPQEPVFDPSLTASEFVALSLPPDPELARRQHLVEATLAQVGVASDRLLRNLSGGEGRRISLAAALVAEPDILLLDEPTNHLDIPAIEWLEEHLAAFTGGLLLVSHDRTFLRRLSRRTLWLDRGTLRDLDRGYEPFEGWADDVLAAEAAAEARLDKRIASETLWMREGISARRRRNQGRVRRLAEMRRQRAERVGLRQAKLTTATAEVGGRLAIELEGVSKAFADPTGAKVIARRFSTRVLRGDRVGLIGPNGAGKSTLLGLMTGTIAPDSGTVRLGTNLMPAIFDQQRATLDPEATLWDTLTEGSSDNVVVQGQSRHVTSYLKDFLFEDRQFRSKVSSLSGGERNRLLLAKILAQRSNLLILDEPTNDLDIDTLDLLEDVLADYDGTLLLVSHDRDFLDRLVTSLIAVEGAGVIDEYVGGYTDYLRQRRPPSIARPLARHPAKTVERAPETRPTKLGWREQQELDALPGQIEVLESEKTAVEAALANHGLYAQDRAAFAETTARHAVLIKELARAEERWLELAARAEELARSRR